MWCSLAISAFFLVTVNCNGDSSEDGAIYEIRMPFVRPQKDDLMLCYARRVDSPLYIVGFQPFYNKSINHHIIIYGCGESATGQEHSSLDRVWNCGEMMDPSYNDKTSSPVYEKGPICDGDEPPSFVWSWAMGAPPFSFPEGVSYKVGTRKLRYLVMQVHYKDTTVFRPPNHEVDNAGVQLKTVSRPTPKLAGIFLLASSEGMLPPKETSYFDIACRLSEPGLELHPFAVRTHAHGYALVSSGYRIRDGHWTEIGRQSPQLPQTFYDVTNPGMTIRPGDILAARCTYYNKEERPIRIGGTQYDEMCNYYFYYYTTNGVQPDTAFCLSPGPPEDVWEDFPEGDMNLAEMPKTVSVVPPPPPGIVPMNHDDHDQHNAAAHDGHDGSMKMVGTYKNNKVAKEGFYYQQPSFAASSHRVHRNWVEEDPETLYGNANINDDDDGSNRYYQLAGNNYDADEPYGDDDQQEQQEQMAALLAAL